MARIRIVSVRVVWTAVALFLSLSPLVHALVPQCDRCPSMAATFSTEISASEDYIRRGWTREDLRVMNESTKASKAKLASFQAAVTKTGIRPPRPIAIAAERVHIPSMAKTTTGTKTNNSNSGERDDKVGSVTKLIHFQRHGEGYHNLFEFLLQDNGIQPNRHSKDVAVNPWIRPEIVDAPLTETGKNQCAQRRPEASLLNPEVILVSPLCRAIDTAKISFADLYPNNQSTTKTSSTTTTTTAIPNGSTPPSSTTIPWIVHEGCREDLGVLVCNKRRKWSEIQADYPELDFSLIDLATDKDILWEQLDDRETPDALSNRIYNFLVDVVMERPEEELAVVTHSGWLFLMCNDVVECGTDATLENQFLTSEIRSMRLTFTKAKPKSGNRELP